MHASTGRAHGLLIAPTSRQDHTAFPRAMPCAWSYPVPRAEIAEALSRAPVEINVEGVRTFDAATDLGREDVRIGQGFAGIDVQVRHGGHRAVAEHASKQLHASLVLLRDAHEVHF